MHFIKISLFAKKTNIAVHLCVLWRVTTSTHKFYQSIYIFSKARVLALSLNLFNLFWCFDEKGIRLDYEFERNMYIHFQKSLFRFLSNLVNKSLFFHIKNLTRGFSDNESDNYEIKNTIIMQF
jgi:hypothetical protein